MGDEATNVHAHPSAVVASLEERRKIAKSRKRAAEERRAEMRAKRELPDEVEAEEIAALDEEAIAEAEDEYGAVGKKILVVYSDLGCVILKRPNPALYKKFRDKGDGDTVAFERLVRPSVVYPDAVALDLILDELAGVLDRCANAVVELAGFRGKEVSGK